MADGSIKNKIKLKKNLMKKRKIMAFTIKIKERISISLELKLIFTDLRKTIFHQLSIQHKIKTLEVQ